MKRVLFFILLWSSGSIADSNFNYKDQDYEIDNQTKDQKLNIEMMSGKKDDRRFYQVKKEDVFNYDIEIVLKSITNFSDKCNNDFRDRRKFLAKNKKCKYHNSNLVESIIYRNINKNFTPTPHESERFIVARRIYNRQNFSHNDLIKIYRFKEKENGKESLIIKITQQMLSDKQVKNYIESPVETNSAFEKTFGEYILKSQADGSTKVSFTYSSETTHWLLNKSISVSKVFFNMTNSFELLFKSINTEAKRLSHQSGKES